MKNKKLFAILTLVCFMFTLMPVAAFAAAPTVEYVGVVEDGGEKFLAYEVENLGTAKVVWYDGSAEGGHGELTAISGQYLVHVDAVAAAGDDCAIKLVTGDFDWYGPADNATVVTVALTDAEKAVANAAVATPAGSYTLAQKSYIYAEKTEVEVEDELDVSISLEDNLPNVVYVWFEETNNVPAAVIDAVYDADGNVSANVALSGSIITVTGETAFQVVFDEPGTYDIHAALVNPAGQTGDTWAEKVGKVADYELKTQSGYKTVTVKAELDDTDDYVIVMADGTVVEDGDTYTLPMTGVAANGIDVREVSFKVYKDNTLAETVYAAGIEVDGSNSIDVSDLEVKRSGEVSFDMTVAKVGTHKVYVEIGGFKATLKAAISDSEAEEIELYYVSKTPVNIDTVTDYPYDPFDGAMHSSIVFKIYDANGNELLTTSNGFNKALDIATNYVSIVEQPAKSNLKNTDVKLVRTNSGVIADGWTIGLKDGVTFQEEGTYTFKVALNDGTFAKATVVLKEAGDPVALSATYEADSVQLGDTIKHKSVVWLDANYVATTAAVGSAADVQIAVSGAAVEWVATDDTTINGTPYTAGTIKVKDDEKYVGSTIKVTFIDKENNLVIAKTLVVASEEKDLALDVDAVPVDTTKTITAKLVDETGKSVGLSNVNTADAYVIVLDKPAESDVTAEVAAVNAAKGQFTFAFSCDTVGTVEVQTVLQTNEAGVVRYYTGVSEIKVGATGIEDVVVMSIGSNQVVVNDEVKLIDAAPIVKDARTFVPFRALAESFGATVAFDEATQAVSAELDGTKVVMTIGAAAYTVNGVEKTADVAPFIADSRTMVPVRFVAEAFGITVTPTYDDNGATADILFAK